MFAPILFSAIAFIAVMLLCITIYLFFQRSQNLKFQGQRLEQAVNIQAQGYSKVGAETTGENQDPNQETLRRDMRISSIPWLNNLLSKSFKGKSKSLMILIEQSGLKIKVGEFVLFTLLIGFA